MFKNKTRIFNSIQNINIQFLLDQISHESIFLGESSVVSIQLFSHLENQKTSNFVLLI